MSQELAHTRDADRPDLDFFEYWDNLGFFENLQVILPPQFFVIFEIARVIFTQEMITDALSAVVDISKEEIIETPDRDKSIQINRVERISPLSDNMEIDNYRTIYDLKKTLPRELAHEDAVFNIKLLTKSLLVQKFYESEADQFNPISTSRDERGKDAHRFEQKFYILLDRSRSMDFCMRTFFSKCLAAEFLRRKLHTRAKIFYRPFDSKTGSLFKIERKEDYPVLIERILLTTTGGTSTNLQEAIIQAVRDINFDKDMINSEILVITDGISKIDKYRLKKELGGIRLNVLKIGKDLAEPNFYDMKDTLDRNRIDFDPSSVNLRDIKKKLAVSKKGESVLTANEKRAYHFIMDHSAKLTDDLKEISNRFIEIEDLDTGELFRLTDENLDFISTAVDEFSRIDFPGKPLDELKKLYKRAYFLSQYIELLMENCDVKENRILRDAYERLQQVKSRMLQNPTLLELVMGMKGFEEDSKTLKLARKEAKGKLKEMQITQKKLSNSDLKKAQLLFSTDTIKGSMGLLFKILFLKLVEFVKGLFKRGGKGGDENSHNAGGTPA